MLPAGLDFLADFYAKRSDLQAVMGATVHARRQVMGMLVDQVQTHEALDAPGAKFHPQPQTQTPTNAEAKKEAAGAQENKDKQGVTATKTQQPAPVVKRTIANPDGR